MKKKIIGGAFVLFFIGSLGFVTISEAVGVFENNQIDTYEMDSRRENHRGMMDDEQIDERQEEQTTSDGTTYYRRGNHMNESNGRNQNMMNNSCW